MRTIFLALLLLASTGAIFSQNMLIYKDGATVDTVAVGAVDSIKFLPFSCGETIRYAGKTYHTVSIGTQCWMKENLNAGAMISGSENQSDNGTIEKYCYDNIQANCDVYGGLYQWNEAMGYSTVESAKGICPNGFHVPTAFDFNNLATYVGNYTNSLKAVGQGFDLGEGTDYSGFSGLLAGCRTDNAEFNYIGMGANFWTSTLHGNGNGMRFYLHFDNPFVYRGDWARSYGFSVRCVYNETLSFPPVK